MIASLVNHNCVYDSCDVFLFSINEDPILLPWVNHSTKTYVHV